MKKYILGITAVLSILFFSCQKKDDAAMADSATTDSDQFHIGIVTGTVSQSEDDLRGAEELISRYGSVADGGMIQHLTYPDNFTQEQETVISQIAGLADDPQMKAVVVNQGIPGTAEAFRRIRERRPEVLLLIGESQEDPNIVKNVADVITNVDYISRGYLIINSAKELGATKFIHISFPRHMGIEVLSYRRQIMEKAAADLGIEFINQSAPDPLSDVGVAGAQAFILEQVPAWIQQYGADTAFFTTNDALTEPLIKQTLKYGGIFVEADLPSPLMGYPGALGLDLTNEAGDFNAIVEKEEEVIVAQGGTDRFGTWVYSTGYVTSIALGEHAIKVINGENQIDDKDQLMSVFGENSPGIKWNSGYNIDFTTDTPVLNHFLIYQDTYVFGRGPLGNTDIDIDDKYTYLK